MTTLRSLAVGWAAAGAALVVVFGGAGAATAAAAPSSGQVATAPTTTAPPAPPTTLVPIGSRITPTPNTVPFVTKATHASINPIWAKVALAAVALVILLLVLQAVLTRRSRDGHWTI